MFAPAPLPDLENIIHHSLRAQLCLQQRQATMTSNCVTTHYSVFSAQTTSMCFLILTCPNIRGCLWVLSLLSPSPAGTSHEEVLALSSDIYCTGAVIHFSLYSSDSLGLICFCASAVLAILTNFKLLTWEPQNCIRDQFWEWWTMFFLNTWNVRTSFKI